MSIPRQIRLELMEQVMGLGLFHRISDLIRSDVGRIRNGESRAKSDADGRPRIY